MLTAEEARLRSDLNLFQKKKNFTDITLPKILDKIEDLILKHIAAGRFWAIFLYSGKGADIDKNEYTASGDSIWNDQEIIDALKKCGYTVSDSDSYGFRGSYGFIIKWADKKE